MNGGREKKSFIFLNGNGKPLLFKIKNEISNVFYYNNLFLIILKGYSFFIIALLENSNCKNIKLLEIKSNQISFIQLIIKEDELFYKVTINNIEYEVFIAKIPIKFPFNIYLEHEKPKIIGKSYLSVINIK